MTDTGERTRLMIATGVALLIHGLVLAVLPFDAAARREPLSPPLYVALGPAAPAVENTPPESDQEPQPQPQPEPVPELSSAPPQSSDPASGAAASAPADARPAPTPAPARPTPPTDFVPEPTPEPAGPRERRFGDLGSSAGDSGPRADSGFLGEQIAQFNEFLADNEAALEAYNARQAERARNAEAAAAESAESRASDSALRRELDALLEGIRQASDNVVSAGPAAPGDGSQDPIAGDTPGGVSIGSGDGRRSRTDRSTLSLDGVLLPPGFPPEYPVQVEFSVTAAGVVVAPIRLQPPTPEPGLNNAIESFVRGWRFQSAPAGTATVTGRVTIIVQTR